MALSIFHVFSLYPYAISAKNITYPPSNADTLKK